MRGYAMGWARIGVPYHPGLWPAAVIMIDLTLFSAMVMLWYFQVNPFPRFDRLRERP